MHRAATHPWPESDNPGELFAPGRRDRNLKRHFLPSSRIDPFSGPRSTMEHTGAAISGGCEAIAGRVGSVGSAADRCVRERQGRDRERGGAGGGVDLISAARPQAPRLGSKSRSGTGSESAGSKAGVRSRPWPASKARSCWGGPRAGARSGGVTAAFEAPEYASADTARHVIAVLGAAPAPAPSCPAVPGWSDTCAVCSSGWRSLRQPAAANRGAFH